MYLIKKRTEICNIFLVVIYTILWLIEKLSDRPNKEVDSILKKTIDCFTI